MRSGYVYIMGSDTGTLYVGVTSRLTARILEHKSGEVAGFTAKYGCYRLVWFETYWTRDEARIRERRIKEWRRSWKLMLIEDANPDWIDLAEALGV